MHAVLRNANLPGSFYLSLGRTYGVLRITLEELVDRFMDEMPDRRRNPLRREQVLRRVIVSTEFNPGVGK